jgi:hypothetical protein
MPSCFDGTFASITEGGLSFSGFNLGPIDGVNFPPVIYFPYAWAIWPTSLAQAMSMAP